jgi:hypothetical protein
MSLSRVCVVCAVFLAATQAQEVGSVWVTVEDPAGATAPGAQLTLRGTDGEVARGKSGREGQFRFRNLAPGTYSIEATSPWFANATADAIKVTRGAETAVWIVMQVGQIWKDGCESAPKTSFSPIQSTSSEIVGTVEGPPAGPGPYVKSWTVRSVENVTITVTGPLLIDEPQTKTGKPIASTLTDSEGHFKLAIQNPGRYNVTAHRDDYADFVVEDVEARKGQQTSIVPAIPMRFCPGTNHCEPAREFPPEVCM